MKLNLDKIKRLIDSDVPASRISRRSKISETTIGQLRNGKKDIDSLTIKNAKKLEDCYDFFKDKINKE